MPDSRRSPRFALASQFDARPWSGASLFERGAGDPDPVVMPVMASGGGIYNDALHFLNGNGSLYAFAVALSEWGCGVALLPTDRLRIFNLHPTLKLNLLPSPGNSWWGFPVEGVEIDPAGELIAASDWRRGMIWGGHDAAPPRMSFTQEGDAEDVREAPFRRGFLQNVIVGLRLRGGAIDLDDTTVLTLEELDNGVNDDANDSFRWGVTDDGYVWWCGVGETAAGGIQWLSASFRDRLGFTGLETTRTDNPGGVGGDNPELYVYYQIATHPLPGFITPSRPLARQTADQEEESSTLRLTDGSYSSSWVGSYLGWEIEWVLDGPDGSVDLHTHWLGMRRLYLHSGEPVTLYQNWGDTRRALHPSRVSASQPAYNVSVTTERGGYRGKILCRLHPDTSGERVEWDGALRLRAVITTRLAKREDGV